jgi:hypothetical protein
MLPADWQGSNIKINFEVLSEREKILPKFVKKCDICLLHQYKNCTSSSHREVKN